MRLRRKPGTALYTFVLALILCLTFWSSLSRWQSQAQAQEQKASALIQDEQQKQEERAAAPPEGEHQSEPQKEETKQFIRYAPLKDIHGYAASQGGRVILRESPQREARILAKVKTGDYRDAEILDSTPDFLRVRFKAAPELDGEQYEGRDVEGWAAWGDVMPFSAAIVLDTETGQVVARMALPDRSDEGSPTYRLAFSTDGARAIVYAPWIADACEISTSDYKLKRSLQMSDGLQLEALFYGPADGELYAVTRTTNSQRLDQDAKLNLLRVSEEQNASTDEAADETEAAKVSEAVNPARELSTAASGFVVARDGRTAFMTHQALGQNGSSIIDVVDLETMMVRNTLIVESTPPLNWSGMIVINKDGSKLYTLETGEEGEQLIAAIDTKTGQRARELKLRLKGQGWDGLMPDSIVGDAFFTRVWEEGSEIYNPRGLWLDVNGQLEAEPGIVYAVEAGDARLGLDEHGTQLFKLDQKNHIQERFKIRRPEFEHDKEVRESFGIYSIVPSPDGKRLILFVGQVDGC